MDKPLRSVKCGIKLLILSQTPTGGGGGGGGGGTGGMEAHGRKAFDEKMGRGSGVKWLGVPPHTHTKKGGGVVRKEMGAGGSGSGGVGMGGGGGDEPRG